MGSEVSPMIVVLGLQNIFEHAGICGLKPWFSGLICCQDLIVQWLAQNIFEWTQLLIGMNSVIAYRTHRNRFVEIFRWSQMLIHWNFVFTTIEGISKVRVKFHRRNRQVPNIFGNLFFYEILNNQFFVTVLEHGRDNILSINKSRVTIDLR